MHQMKKESGEVNKSIELKCTNDLTGALTTEKPTEIKKKDCMFYSKNNKLQLVKVSL